MASRLHSYTVRRILRIIGVVVLSFVAVFGLGFAVIRVFSIQQVEMDGQGMAIELDKTKLGENLLFIPTDRLRDELISTYPLLSTVRFEKRFPGTLVIHLVKRVPLAVVITNGIPYALDATGVVLENAPSGGQYPTLRYDVGLLSIGSRVTDVRIKASLAFLNELHGSLEISRMGEGDGASIQAIMGDTRIMLPQQGDLQAKADTLQTIVEGFRIKGTLPAVIDLRFDKPIVTN